MLVTIIAPESASEWAGEVTFTNWAEFADFLEILSNEFPKLLIQNEDGDISVEILA